MLILNLPRSTLDMLLTELETAGCREIGGILMGEQLSPGRFRVTEMTFQRPGGWVAHFVRSAKSALAALKHFFDRSGHRYQQFNYLGEWHSHPSFAAIPSATDHASMLEIVADPKTGANFVVLLIVKLTHARSLEAGLMVYLPDGTAFSGRLDFEESGSAALRARSRATSAENNGTQRTNDHE